MDEYDRDCAEFYGIISDGFSVDEIDALGQLSEVASSEDLFLDADEITAMDDQFIAILQLSFSDDDVSELYFIIDEDEETR